MLAPLVLFAVALAVRALAGLAHPDPAYPDSFYYVNVARQLAAGNGYTVDYVWNFVDVGGRLPTDPHLPIPANGHWMPLAELVQVPFVWLLGSTGVAAALPFWLVGALVAPLTYLIGLDAGFERGGATVAGLLVAFPLGTTPFLAQPDNFALFMLLGALALWLCARAVRPTPQPEARLLFALGGVVVGLATLARNDGVLLGIPYAIAFLGGRINSFRSSRAGPIARGRSSASPGWTAAALCVLGFAFVVTPWYVRQLDVFGSISPSAANGRILWITEYQQLFSISSETTLSSFLEQDAGKLIASRVIGLLNAVKWFLVAPLLVFLAPFVVIGASVRRRDAAFRPWLIYAGSLFAFSAVLFAVHVDHGTFLHSAVALTPHAYLLSVAGIAAAIQWVARRRPHWDPPKATRNFMALAVALAVLLSAAATWRVQAAWAAERDVRTPIFAALANTPAGDRVMSPDPGAYRYWAGRGGVITPYDPLEVVESTLRAYGIRWLVIERDYVLPAYVPLLTGQTRPEWLSTPVAIVPGPPADGASLDRALAATPRVALFAVCLAPSDDRCSP